ncbi:tyrosine-type recombinase/integrase [Luteibacter sp. 9135]|uniref:tyrosine-type recombinase/integrase n=1 Tax=Luteibacter sp. 9135 TaxID=1500893 RepID=UPI00056CACC9|nr:tyrosine-type recombinase/integrase [Luteibacter sp. 9135]
MTEACYAALKRCKAVPDGPFSTITKYRAGHVWRKAMKHAGVTEPECVVHSLRHTCATGLLETMGDIKLVQEWLGHTSIMTTARTYAHVQSHRMVDAAALLTASRHLNAGKQDL